MRHLSAIAVLMLLTAVNAGASEASRQPAARGSTLALAGPEWRRPIPIGTEDSRLVGEAATREFPLYLTASEATRPAKIRLAYVSAVSVMPETFNLTLKINDKVVGATALQRSDEPEVLNLSVPAGLLEAGFNSIRISVRQSHRVDCSANATYELWTQLLPEQSGLAFSGTSGEIRDLADLPALRTNQDGSVRIRVSADDEVSPAGIGRASRAAQAAALLGRYAVPQVEFASEHPNEPGLDVVVGTAPFIERTTGIKVPGLGPRTRISHNPQDGRAVLAIAGDSDAEIEAALDALSEQASRAVPQGSAAGVRALRNIAGHQVKGKEHMTLASLGLDSEASRGRLQRQTVHLQMPADLLVADYGQVRIAVDAIYASGLSPDSKLTVRVNGAPIADVALSNAAGEVISKRLLQLPVRTFKPGLNTIDFEGVTPSRHDQACDLTALTDQRERFLLSGTSEITVPPLALVGSLPNISAMIPGGLTRMSAGNEIGVFVPQGRLGALNAALTMLAKMASVSGQVTRATFSFDMAPEKTAHVVAFGAYDDLPEATLRAAGLDPADLRKAWQRSATGAPDVAESRPPFKVASIDSVIELDPKALNPKPVVGSDSPPPARSLTMAPAQEQASDLKSAFEQGRSSWIQDYAQPAYEALSKAKLISLVPEGLRNSRETEKLAVTDSSALVIAQAARAKGDETGLRASLLPSVRSTTVIVAPTPEALSNSVTTLLSGSLWHRLVGAAAVYSATENSVSTRVSPDIVLVPTAALGPENIRLIAAGWLSRNTPVYLAVLIGVFLVMTGLAYRLLRSSGVRES